MDVSRRCQEVRLTISDVNIERAAGALLVVAVDCPAFRPEGPDSTPGLTIPPALSTSPTTVPVPERAPPELIVIPWIAERLCGG